MIKLACRELTFSVCASRFQDFVVLTRVCINQCIFASMLCHLFNNSCLQAIILLPTVVLYFLVKVCGTKSFIARTDTPTFVLSAVGSMTAKVYRNGSVQTVHEGCHFGTCWLRL